VRRKSKHANGKQASSTSDSIQGERLHPVRVIERELTRPDGTTLKVSVPVYPPFRLKQRPPAKPEESDRKMRKTG